MELPNITSVMLVLTHACNLRCRYCFVQQKPQTMTYQVAKDAVDWLVKNTDGTKDKPTINFFGGEPTLCWDSIIVPLAKYIREELNIPFSLGMTSNGILLDEEKLQFMEKYDISMLFSIDGDKETQDYNRPLANGGSSFDKLDIDNIVKYRNPTFRSTVIPHTCHNVFHNIEFAISKGFQSFFVIPNVFEEWTDEKWNILATEMRKYSDYYIDCYNNNKIPISFSVIDTELKKIERINSAVSTKSFRTYNWCQSISKCGLGATKFASVHPNGNLYACQEMTSNDGENNLFYIGNIYSGINTQKRETLANLFDPNKIHSELCDSCKQSRICDGGCVANNFFSTGDINKPSLVWCKWQELMLDEVIYIATKLAYNPDFIKKWRNINGYNKKR